MYVSLMCPDVSLMWFPRAYGSAPMSGQERETGNPRTRLASFATQKSETPRLSGSRHNPETQTDRKEKRK